MLSEKDYKKYIEYLEGSHMSDEQKKEYLDQMWLIMQSFVDLAFEQSPVQVPLNEKERSIKDVVRKFVNENKE